MSNTHEIASATGVGTRYVIVADDDAHTLRLFELPSGPISVEPALVEERPHTGATYVELLDKMTQLVRAEIGAEGEQHDDEPSPPAVCHPDSLLFLGQYGAPGIGSAYECSVDGSSWSKLGGTYYPAEWGVHIGRPSDFE